MSTADAAAAFAALGEPIRLSLVLRLSDGQTASIAVLAAGRQVSRQAISKHLSVLEDAGIVGHVRIGRESRYTLRPESLGAVSAYLDGVSAQWDAALGRLRALVEDQPSG